MLRCLFPIAIFCCISTITLGQGQTKSTETIFAVVEEKPRFPGCEDTSGSKREKERCSLGKLMNYISQNLSYPSAAEKNRTEGKAVIKFTVERDGSIGTIAIIQDPGDGLGAEAQRVVEKMNTDGIKWRPAYQRGKPVRSHFKLPVNYKLPPEDKKKASKAEVGEKFTAPRFPGCEDDDVPGKYKYLCSQKKFVDFLDRYIRYPKDAVKQTIQGKVLVSFIVEVDGTISSTIVERSPNQSLGEECLAAVNLLKEEEELWTPAMLDGQPVRSRIDLPIDFKLGYKSIKSKKPITYVNIPALMESLPVDETGRPMTSPLVEIDQEKIYDDVEESPYFQTCKEEQSTLIERFKCSRSSYNAYIQEHLIYPVSAKQNRIQGVAKVECVIEIDGSVSSPRLLRNPGSGLGEEALRLISEMKDSVGLWTSGEISGLAVRTKMELPVRFVLKAEDINPLVIILDKKKNVIHDCIRTSDLTVFKSIPKAKIKKIKPNKAQAYGEKGRYGIYTVKLPKGKGKVPSSIKKQEEVEAYEMYFEGMSLTPSETDRKVDISFNNFKEEGEIVIYSLSGRTLLTETLEIGTFVSRELDLEDLRGELFFISITQKDLVHTKIVKF